ncbi:MAG: fluoride efflux transporter FluC [Wenzhouxiangella sp.]
MSRRDACGFLLAAGLGGALGSAARLGASLVLVDLPPATFPWSTFSVNVIGALLIGLLAAISQPGHRWQMRPNWQAFWLAGFCGGLTTFSFVSLELALMWQGDNPASALVYLGLALGAWLIGVSLGWLLGSQI